MILKFTQNQKQLLQNLYLMYFNLQLSKVKAIYKKLIKTVAVKEAAKNCKQKEKIPKNKRNKMPSQIREDQ
jgi:hypothetical protein